MSIQLPLLLLLSLWGGVTSSLLKLKYNWHSGNRFLTWSAAAAGGGGHIGWSDFAKSAPSLCASCCGSVDK